MLFESGVKADFTLGAAILLKLGRFSLAQQNGFIIHLDKDEVLRNWRIPPLKPSAPSEEKWRATMSEFWMEAWNWAKYLARQDLWHAKIRDNDCKNALLQMLEWHALAQGEIPLHAGHFLENWSNLESSEIAELWSDYSSENQRRALEKNCVLFDKISREVAENWDLPLEVISIRKNLGANPRVARAFR